MLPCKVRRQARFIQGVPLNTTACRTPLVARNAGAPWAPRRRQLVGFADVHAVNRGVEAREPAFGLVAYGLLVLQVRIGAGVHDNLTSIGVERVGTCGRKSSGSSLRIWDVALTN